MVSTRNQLRAPNRALRAKNRAELRAQPVKKLRRKPSPTRTSTTEKVVSRPKPPHRELVHQHTEHIERDDTACAASAVNAFVTNDPEPIGLPLKVHAAYMRRFCWGHRDTEWLLQFEDRWMRLSDFTNDHGKHGVVESQMEQRFAEFRANPVAPKPYSRSSHVTCCTGLSEQTDAVVDKKVLEGEQVFKIRWKLQWVVKSYAGDEGWLQQSMTKMNMKHERRYSHRNQETSDEYAAKRRGILAVLDLEFAGEC